MATTQDYSTVAGPCATRYFATPDATNWCVITPPPWVMTVTVTNRGVGKLYVAIVGGGTQLVGAASGTSQYAKEVAAGGAVSLAVAGNGWAENYGAKFSVFGADGATHPMDFIFDASAPRRR